MSLFKTNLQQPGNGYTVRFHTGHEFLERGRNEDVSLCSPVIMIAPKPLAPAAFSGIGSGCCYRS